MTPNPKPNCPVSDASTMQPKVTAVSLTWLGLGMRVNEAFGLQNLRQKGGLGFRISGLGFFRFIGFRVLILPPLSLSMVSVTGAVLPSGRPVHVACGRGCTSSRIICSSPPSLPPSSVKRRRKSQIGLNLMSKPASKPNMNQRKRHDVLVCKTETMCAGASYAPNPIPSLQLK